MAKTLKDKLVDMVVMTVARDATKSALDKAKKIYKDSREKTNVRKRDRSDRDDELEP